MGVLLGSVRYGFAGSVGPRGSLAPCRFVAFGQVVVCLKDQQTECGGYSSNSSCQQLGFSSTDSIT